MSEENSESKSKFGWKTGVAATVFGCLAIYSVVQQVALVTLDYGGIKETLVVSRRGAGESILAEKMQVVDDARRLCIEKIMSEGEYFPGMTDRCLQRFTYFLYEDGMKHFTLPFSSSVSRP